MIKIKLSRPISRLLSPDDLMGFKEVAEYLKVTPQTIRNYLNPKRPNSRFPKPLKYLAATPVWDRREIEAYKRYKDGKGKGRRLKRGGKTS